MRIDHPAPWATRLSFSHNTKAMQAPYIFTDGQGEYLRLERVTFEEKTLFHTVVDGEPVTQTKLTANGEVTEIINARRVPSRTVRRVTLRFACGENELLTGLGQHEDGVYDYRHRTEYLYQNNMIIAIPFLLSSAGYGVLIEAECAMRFTGEPGGFTFTLEAVDDFSLVVLRGADGAAVLRRLAEITGRTRLLPRWAYGYVQSKERYHSAEELTDTARRFRRDGLGMDCLVQDWYTWKPGLWGDKTPDASRFPSVAELVNSLHRLDTHLLVSIWPNMAKGSADLAEFQQAGKLLPNSDTYDAYDPDARALYASQCERFWGAGGVDGYWCDNAEPFSDPDWNGENKRPDEVRYALVTGAAARSIDETRLNSYALYHAQGMFEHWRRNHPNKRLVNLTRSGYTGVQRYGTVLWSGDISARWDVLRNQIAEGLKMAMSGVSHWTLDAGGFFVVKDAYDKRGCECAGVTKKLWFWNGEYNDGVDDPDYRELYARWLQYSCFLPMFRSHGTDTPREPWHFGHPGDATYDAVAGAISLRYRLLPYVYATAAQCWFTGDPMLRSLLTAFPEDRAAWPVCDSFLLGDALLVKPVTKPLSEGGGRTNVYLPAGTGWYDWHTGAYSAGGQTVTVDTPLRVLPVFLRAGAVLPLSRGGTCEREIAPLGDTLLVATGADGGGWLYGDAGDGYEYETGVYTRARLTWNQQTQTLTLGKAEGSAELAAQFNLRFLAPDGTETRQSVRYTGEEIAVRREAAVE